MALYVIDPNQAVTGLGAVGSMAVVDSYKTGFLANVMDMVEKMVIPTDYVDS
jgi:hypothetical protein